MFFTSSLRTDLAASMVALVVIVFAYFKWSFQYWKKKNVPYLEPSVPLGNITNPLTNPKSIGDFILEIYNDAKAKDLELLKHILAKDFNHFLDRGIYVNEIDEPIGNNLFAMAGTRWKTLRYKLTPTFTPTKLRAMFQTITDCGEMLENFIKENVAEKEVADMKDVLGRFSTDVIGSCAFGLDCNSFKNPDSPFRAFGKKVFQFTTMRYVRDMFTFNFPNLSRSLRMPILGKDVVNFYTEVVKDTIAYREKNNVIRNDFMQLLMAMRSKNEEETTDDTLTMDEIVAQSFVFFVAGFETSSSTMTIALFEMARHPEVQEKAREEIRTVLGRHNNKMTYDSINELVYLKQVIDETLRMYPSLVVLTRRCAKDYKVPGEDFVLEKGCTVFIPVIGIHYDKDYYENPEQFNPDRFSRENKKKIPPYAHLPFGEGPRMCIGERFGIMQTKVGLVSVLRNFKVSMNEKTKFPLKLDPRAQVTAIKGGVWLNIEKVGE